MNDLNPVAREPVLGITDPDAQENTETRQPILIAHNIGRHFMQVETPLQVLQGASLVVYPGELVALVGPSGAGKSTLLQICGLLEPPDLGEIYILGKKCNTLSDPQRTRLRLQTIGFIYQRHHLLSEFSALENVQIPQMLGGLSKKEARSRARELLAMVGLSEREKHRPGRLSGGEQQRVAIARSLANAPRLLIADEPTGNLDPQTAEDVFSILYKLVRGVGLAGLVATHNLELAARMDRVLIMRGGLVEAA